MLQKLQQILGGSIKENEPLKNHTTFKIGGAARYFFVAESEDEVVKAIREAKDLELDYFILGGGSNVLVSDSGFDGLVVKISDFGFRISDFEIEASAGVSLQVLVQEAAKAGLSGLEYAVGIPGTLGGAIFGNAGGRDWAIGDVVKSVKLLWPPASRHPERAERVEESRRTSSSVILRSVSDEESRGNPTLGRMTRTDVVIEEKDREWMEFGYRESKLKKFPTNERPIILSAVLELRPGNPEKIKKIMFEKMAGREQKIPKEPSAGCVFKNLPNTPASPKPGEGGSVGQLIDSLGLKGKCVGDACISELHANFIINKGNATAKDVKELIDLIKKTVKEKKGIELKEEIQYLGF